MFPYDKNNPFRKLSVRLLLPLLIKSRLSTNKITVLNFLILGLGSVALLLSGCEYLSLLPASLMAAIDYCDGTLARLRNESSALGQYLDTSLDWLYLMLVIGVLSYHHDIMSIGYIALIALTWGNWVEYNGNVSLKLPFLLSNLFILGFSILINQAKLGIIILTIIQTGRTGWLYGKSISRK